MKKLSLMCAVVLGFVLNASAQDNNPQHNNNPEKKGFIGRITTVYNVGVAAPFGKTIAVTSNAKTPQKYLAIISNIVAKAAATIAK